MQKKYIITTSVVVFIGIIGLVLFFQGKFTWNPTNTGTDESSPTAREEQRVIAENINKKNAEFYNTAIKEQDPKLCEGITKINKQEECRDMIAATQAKKSWNIEACNALTNTGITLLCRDVIRSDRAVVTRNKILCEKVLDPTRKLYCQDEIDTISLQENAKTNTLTRDLCDKLWTEQRWNCLSEVAQTDETTIYQTALKDNNLDLCKTIRNKEVQVSCTDTIYLKLAISKNDALLCDTITDKTKTAYCKAQVSKNNDTAIYRAAISTTDIENCSKIIDVRIRNKCNDTIIISRVKNEKNTALCTSLTNTGIIASCQKI